MNEKRKILIVDDESYIRESIERALISRGFSAESSHNAEDAVLKFKKSHFDLLITDYNMPGKNGLELTKDVKIINPDIQVIVMTSIEGFKNEIDKSGIFGCLEKPFHLLDLLVLVVECFQENQTWLMKVKAHTEERRRKERRRAASVSAEVSLKEGRLIEVSVKDISQMGACIYPVDNIRVGEKVEINLRLFAKLPSVKYILSEIAWIDEKGYCGVEFVMGTKEAAELLKGYLAG